NTTSTLLNSQLPPLDPGHSNLPTHPFRAHVRSPTAAGLVLQTDLNFDTARAESHSKDSQCLLENTAGDQLHHSATTPVAVQEGYLRSALSAASMTESLSPASALSSPALNALTDITPLPSPLVIGDTSGPWARAGAAMRPRSRGTSSASAKDDPFALFAKGGLSPSNSLKKKSYQTLQAAAVEKAAVRSEAHREKSRSVSELVPDAFHNLRPRHVTISSVAPERIEAEGYPEPHLHREAYLAPRRGLVSALPTGLPTPPASNASNKSVTESESEDVAEDDKIDYITVRHGSQKTKRLWRPIRKLGQGTFSKVYLATSEKLPANDPLDESVLDPRQLVAIKVVEHGPAGGADAERVELSLKREVEMLRDISHPSLVHLRAFDNGDDRALLVLSYCPGGDLFEVASTQGELLRCDVVQRIFAELVSAVHYLHENLIVHRDIKLENVLLNLPITQVGKLKNVQSHPYPLVTLTDLGLSRRIPPPPGSPLLTTRCGSEDYAAPEILLGQPYDGRSTDAWAVGVLLYALMEGRLPFDPPPGKPVRGRATHRIARCDWMWGKFGDVDGEWDPQKGRLWTGAKECVEALLKKVSRGRKSLAEIAEMEWVKKGIAVEGGLRRPVGDD
ncbi:kinase-like protein, partial [Sporormia fimetaria CBS 119925]